MTRIVHTTVLPAVTAASTLSQTIDLSAWGEPDIVGLQLNYANATTGAKTFGSVNTTNDTAVMTAHGQVLGSLGQVSNSGGALPSGLTGATNYFLIIVDANTVKFATSLANAVAGTAVDLTTAGTGTQTFTPTVSSANVIKARYSADNVNFTDVTTTAYPNLASAAVTVATTNGSVYWDFQRLAPRFINILYTPTAGQITFSVIMDGKK